MTIEINAGPASVLSFSFFKLINDNRFRVRLNEQTIYSHDVATPAWVDVAGVSLAPGAATLSFEVELADVSTNRFIYVDTILLTDQVDPTATTTEAPATTTVAPTTTTATPTTTTTAAPAVCRRQFSESLVEELPTRINRYLVPGCSVLGGNNSAAIAGLTWISAAVQFETSQVDYR